MLINLCVCVGGDKRQVAETSARNWRDVRRIFVPDFDIYFAFHLASEVCKSGVEEEKCTHPQAITTHTQSERERAAADEALSSVPCGAFIVHTAPTRHPHPPYSPSPPQPTFLPINHRAALGTDHEAKPLFAGHGTPRTHTALHSTPLHFTPLHSTPGRGARQLHRQYQRCRCCC